MATATSRGSFLFVAGSAAATVTGSESGSANASESGNVNANVQANETANASESPNANGFAFCEPTEHRRFRLPVREWRWWCLQQEWRCRRLPRLSPPGQEAAWGEATAKGPRGDLRQRVLASRGALAMALLRP